MKINIFILLSITLFSSCSIIDSLFPSDYPIINADKKEGIVVGSFSFENLPLLTNSITIYFLNDSILNLMNHPRTGYPNPFKIKHTNRINYEWKAHYKENNKRIYLFFIKRPYGSYEFNECEIFLNTGTMTSTRHYSIKIPFDIIEGKTTYIGEINFNVKTKSFDISDNIKRDSALLKERYPNFVIDNYFNK